MLSKSVAEAVCVCVCALVVLKFSGVCWRALGLCLGMLPGVYRVDISSGHADLLGLQLSGKRPLSSKPLNSLLVHVPQKQTLWS